MSTFSFTAAINNLVGNTPGANVSNLVQCLNDLKGFINGANLDSTNIALHGVGNAQLAVATQQQLGLTDGVQVGRGKSIIATTGTRTNVAYGALSDGPDQVSSVVVPTDAIVSVSFQGLWKESNASAARAAVFIGATQLQTPQPGGATTGPEATIGGTPNLYVPLTSWVDRLESGAGVTADSTEVTTGQAMASGTAGRGGWILIDNLAAGTYTISVQFRCTSGTVTVKNRRLRVKVETFS